MLSKDTPTIIFFAAAAAALRIISTRRMFSKD
jgi:hypothetical protein